MSATPPKPAPQVHTFRRFTDGDQEWKSLQDRIFTADATDKCPTYVHKTPPCQASCPSGEDIRGWLNIVRGVERPPVSSGQKETALPEAINVRRSSGVMSGRAS